MASHYTLVAVRKGVANRIPCSSATMAVAEKQRLRKQGWRVSVSNDLGILMTTQGLDRLVKVETASSGKPDGSP